MSALVRPAATLSPCGLYRYQLRRDVELTGAGWVLFVMLNPSTADATVDDPTIRRCFGFAQSWGFRGFEVGNLFGYRATNPAELGKVADPIGPDNDEWILRLASRADRVVCAWGAHGVYRDRGAAVLDIMRKAGAEPMVFGLTKSGQPKHPLYLPATSQLVRWAA